MKLHTLLLCALCASAFQCSALDVITTDGRRYRDCSQFIVRGMDLSFLHNSGHTKVPYEKLPVELQRHYFASVSPDKLKQHAAESERAALIQRAVARDKMLKQKYRAEEDAGRVRSFIVTMQSLTPTGFLAARGGTMIHVTGDLSLTRGSDWYGWLRAAPDYEYTTVLGARQRVENWIPMEPRDSAIGQLESYDGASKEMREAIKWSITACEDSIAKTQRALERK